MDRRILISTFPEVSIFQEDDNFQKSIELIHENGACYTYRFSMKAKQVAPLSPVTLSWKVPFVNMGGIWKSGAVQDKRQQYDWELEHLKSRISVDAPVIAVFGLDDTNAMTFACSDAINMLEMNALLREEDNHLYCHITFFKEAVFSASTYEAEIRIDQRSVPFSLALQGVSQWWESFTHLRPAKVPEIAKVPLYSTWYQFHQSLEEDTLLEEAKIAADLGYQLMLIDDGWQTHDSNRGYDYTGDWESRRFTDMALFVEQIQSTGMKVGLWYSVPFCGQYSKAYQRFKGKFLTENHRWAPVFDPRYPEVRDYLISIYTNALKDWNLDAFKLDFIDDFRVYPETPLTLADGRDFVSVDAAVDRLLTDVLNRLRAIKPNVGIEFRQKYIGPTMRKFGNMFRAFDCPNDPVSNRIRITDVKLLMHTSAVHSDPITWHANETVELASLQVLNAIFGVPQMSVHLRQLPEEKKRMLYFYTQYWLHQRHILLEGDFRPYRPTENYPLLSASNNDHLIIGVYDNLVIDLGEQSIIDLLNAKPDTNIIIRCEQETNFQITTWNCMGEKEYIGFCQTSNRLAELEVKVGGMVRLKKM